MTTREEGSVLIEAMIAAAIVAMMLAAMYRGLADSAMREQQLADRRIALLIAQSELDAVGSALPLVTGSSSGIESGYAWRVDITPYSASQGSGTAGPLWAVAVSVRPSGGGPNLVTLRTLTMGPAA